MITALMVWQRDRVKRTKQILEVGQDDDLLWVWCGVGRKLQGQEKAKVQDARNDTPTATSIQVSMYLAPIFRSPGTLHRDMPSVQYYSLKNG